MPAICCPKCGQPVTDAQHHALLGRGVERHCPQLPSRSCVWITHVPCGAVIDHRHPSRWLDHKEN